MNTTKPKFPRIGDLAALFVSLKKHIDDDYRVEFQDDDIPTMQVTIGCDLNTGEWSYQTGDNSFTGGAYGYRDWAVVYLQRRSNSRDLARDVISQF